MTELVVRQLGLAEYLPTLEAMRRFTAERDESSPDEIWLLTAPADGEELVAALQAALLGIDHSLVDISHRQAALELSGTHAAWLLNAGCPLDLAPAAFPVDTVTRTVFVKAEIVLWRTGAESFRLEFGRSFRGYVAGLLAEVTRELAAA